MAASKNEPAVNTQSEHFGTALKVGIQNGPGGNEKVVQMLFAAEVIELESEESPDEGPIVVRHQRRRGRRECPNTGALIRTI